MIQPTTIKGMVSSIEAKYASGFGGKGFWLFVFNLLFSVVLVVWLSGIMAFRLGNPWVFILGVVVVVGFLVFFEVDDAWYRLTYWRRKR